MLLLRSLPANYLLLALMVLAISSHGYGQQKFEKESRIRMEDAPERAREFVAGMAIDGRIKWYLEIGTDRTSYEAKFRRDGKKHSVEFSDQGVFEDLEIAVPLGDLPVDSRERISRQLAENHGKYAMEKVQIQYTGEPEAITRWFLGLKPDPDVSVHYEMVVSAKVDGSFTLFEYLFDAGGAFIERVQITLRTTDNIIY